MLNRCEFIGNLGRDPEVRTTQSGTTIVHLSLGVTDKWKSKDGERKEKTEWVRVVIFNEKLAEVAEKYLRKGSRVFIAGAMSTRKWTDKSGVEKYTTEIVLQSYRGELVMLGEPQGATGQRGDDGNGDEIDDEIPF